MNLLTDQDKLVRWHDKWITSTNPVTRAAWREMYLRLYFELYV